MKVFTAMKVTQSVNSNQLSEFAYANSVYTSSRCQ